MGNVIDIRGRIKSKKNQAKQSPVGKVSAKNAAKADVVDITSRRQEVINQERRLTKRTLLSEWVGAFAVVPQHGLQKVTLYDISETGLSFDLELREGQFRVGEELAMRIYLNQDNYLPLSVRISNIREISDEGVIRHGASFVDGKTLQEAVYHFIRFIENASSSVQRDNGDLKVSNRR